MKTMPSPHATAVAMVFSITFAAAANPTGGMVQGGAASFHSNGSTLTVNAGNNAVINWQSFNIGAGEHTVFNQPSSTSIVWNRIADPNPSQIYGSLQANGVVVLLNSSGFYFGPNSFVSAAGLVVSTANCTPPENTGGGWTFNGPPPLASIINYGQIKIGNGGDCFLVADQVQNHGDIFAPGGNVALAAGQTVTISERPDGRGMSMQVTLPQGSVDNHGNIVADGGTIALNAKVVNQGGFIQANSVKDDHGVIELVASDSLNLESGSQISASGDDSVGGSAGGTVTLKSGNTFSDADGSRITLTGGANGGNGGSVEVSAPNVESLDTAMDAGAQAGSRAGSLLIDPTTINLGASGTGTVPANGTVASGSTPATLNLNINNAFANKNFSSILLQATGNINLLAGTTWDLSASTGKNAGQLTLEAGGNININNGSEIVDANDWSINLFAGYDFTQNTVKQNTGSILFNGTGSIQSGGGAINLFAGNAITLGSGFIQSVGDGSSVAGAITLQAGNGISTGSGSQISDVGSGAITVDAGYNFAQGKVVTGGSSLLLGDSSFIQSAAGDINLAASDNITVNSGYVITTGGGNINAHALTGSIDAGSDAQGYTFTPNATTLAGAYSVQSGLGGISTANGGNVTLIAGGNVSSVLPLASGSYEYDGLELADANVEQTETAGVGAYGRGKLGNVTVVAGGDVVGNYLLADGKGSIYAGAKMDANGNPIANGQGYLLGTTGNAGNSTTSLALSLIGTDPSTAGHVASGWSVNAAQNILLNEVSNPNGLYNNVGSSAIRHLFDYASDDYVNLTAGNQVQLGAHSLPRLDISPAPIYPGTLTVNAGAGGVLLDGSTTFNSLTLFPSPTGSLTIDTTGGGSLIGNLPQSSSIPQSFFLIVSDSGSSQYHGAGSFGVNDHAANPIHAGSEVPVQLNVSGDMDLVQLDSPEVSHINVVGNMNNSSFRGMNLSAADTTTITVGAQAKANMENSGILNAANDGSLTVGGNITDRSAFTSIDLSQISGAGVPDFSMLQYALPPAGQPNGAILASSFYYNPTTHILTYQFIPGKTSFAQILATLENLTVQVVVNGVPQWEDTLHTIPKTTTISAISATAASALLAQYNALGAAPTGNAGFILGGGGKFEIQANNVDLGSSPGIQANGVGFDQTSAGFPLAKLFNTGADINLDLAGNLTMYSSSIATLNGSSIGINVAGSVNVGSPDFTVTATGARGIYTTGQGDCTVVAGGDININGSRIAAFNGGSVTVESLNGNVNAGTGGGGFVQVSAFEVNPQTHAIFDDIVTIPGSGILTTTFPDDPSSTVGNILVETPHGNINANSGGIVQLPLNHSDSSHSHVDLLAGYQLLDAANNPVYAYNIENGHPVEILSQDYSQQNDLGNIDTSGSGVIAENALIRASGIVKGTVFSKNGLDVVAPTVTSFTGLGKVVTVSANNFGGGVTLVGSESVSTSGGATGGDILSANANGGGSSFAVGTSANATSAGASAQSVAAAEKAASNATDSNADGDDEKKKKKTVSLAQKVSRVTVLLPGQNN